MDKVECNVCGSRLKKDSLNFLINKKNIYELCSMDINNLRLFIQKIKLSLNKRDKIVADEILKEISKRLEFLINVGLDYLCLNRTSRSLSGGESQRIRLATQIGSQLVGVLYILDEPSIGLHQSDNSKLISSLKGLRDLEIQLLLLSMIKK